MGPKCPTVCETLVPGPGIKPVSLALQGGFLTTGPPGKPQVQLLWWQTSLHASTACDP